MVPCLLTLSLSVGVLPQTSVFADDGLIIPTAEANRTVGFSEDFDEADPSDWSVGDNIIIGEEDGNKFYQVQEYDYLQFPYADKLTNFTLEFNIKFKLGKPGECWPAFYLKSLGQPNRYEVYLESNPDNQGICLKRSLDGVVATTPYDVKSLDDRWLYMKLQVEGNQVNVYINDKTTPVFSYTDSNPLDCGPMGFVQGGCKSVYIDNVLVSVPNEYAIELEGGAPLPPKTPNEYNGTIANINFENMSTSPFTDLRGESSIIDYNGSKSLSVGELAVIGDSSWTNYSAEFDLTMKDITLSDQSLTIFYPRYLDSDNKCSVSINPALSAANCYGSAGGNSQLLCQTGVFFADGITKHIRIDVFDNQYAIYIAGVNYPNFEHPIASFDFNLKNGGFAFARPQNVGELIVDNVKVTKMTSFGEIGAKPSPAPAYTPDAEKYSDFADTHGHWAEKQIKYLVGEGVFSGYNPQTFLPDSPVSVSEFIKILVCALDGSITPGTGSSWAEPYISAAENKGLFPASGFDSYDRSITRGEISEMIANAIDGSDAAELGIIVGYEDGSMHYEQSATRAEAAAMMMRLLVPRYRITSGTVSIAPTEYEKAFKNPLKGFRGSVGDPLASVVQANIFWNQIEQSADDGVDKLLAYADEHWAGYEQYNVKVIPRIILEWPPDGKYWPSDMTTGDYTSEQFMQRAENLIRKMGEAWDNDPRVAYMQVGIIGYWGEMQSPYPTVEVQKVLSDAFAKYFKNKKVQTNIMVKFAFFSDNPVGVAWDSFGHWDNPHGLDYFRSDKFKDEWKTEVIGGETAYDWGDTVGRNINDGVLNYSDRYIELFRATHCTYIGWLAGYSQKDLEIVANAEKIQKVLGYRFVIDRASYTQEVSFGGEMQLDFAVKNTGSAPIYYNWPVEVSLLDPETHEPVWKQTIDSLDITKWLPEDNYSYNPLYSVSTSFTLPESLNGRYILALSILDPEGGNMPAVRFANENYFSGGRTPLGYIGIGVTNSAPYLDSSTFDDIASDSITYKVK